MNRLQLVSAACAAAAILGMALSAQGADPNLEASVRTAVSRDAQPWLADPAVVDAIKAQNAQNQGLTQAKIDELDKQWTAAAKSGSNPLYEKIASNPTSQHLKDVKAKSNGTIVEILVMDAHGLNVGQTDETSDYWQGDEPKWQKVFTGGSDLYMTEPAKDDQTQAMVTEVSVPVIEPTSQEKIGVAMIVLDTAKLGQ